MRRRSAAAASIGSMALKLVRILARGESSIGQLLGYHFVNSQYIYWAIEDPARAHALGAETVAKNLYWGAAVNPRDPGLELDPARQQLCAERPQILLHRPPMSPTTSMPMPRSTTRSPVSPFRPIGPAMSPMTIGTISASGCPTAAASSSAIFRFTRRISSRRRPNRMRRRRCLRPSIRR